MDYGYKKSIAEELIKRGAKVKVFAANTSAEDVLATKPDGIMLSNGPGDPEDNAFVIEQIKIMAKSGLPIFGICLGHQLLALAHGFKTEKLKYGHRGANQPVRNLISGRVYITSQNHGYAVRRDSIDEKIARDLYINVNDETSEGIEYLNAPIFSVQFHPEASSGPLDTRFLFDEFLNKCKKGEISHA
jgi:carbamoyl-phosphate synthase small subunit